MTMTRFAVVFVLLACASRGVAEELCPLETDVAPMTLADIYAKGEAIATGWQADAVLANATTTSNGPLDEEGRSEAWRLLFYSPSANANASFTTFRGMFTCYASEGAAGRIPDLAPDFLRDGARLYAIAKEQGGEFIADGYTVSIQTTAAPETRHAMWYITYANPGGGNAGRTVIVDANTGEVEKVLD
ncbi:MAG: hypothetical protein AAGE01_05690 [Pseudomonadota bacterium]